MMKRIFALGVPVSLLCITTPLLLVLIVGCTPSGDKTATQQSGKPLTVVRFATLPGDLPVSIGLKKGFFAEQGLDVKFINVNGGVEAVTAAAAGEAEFGAMGTPVIIGAAAGVPIKIVGSPTAPGQPFVLIAKPGYKTLADLKGKVVIAGGPGQGTIQAFNYIARSKGLKPSDFQFVNADSSAAVLAALQSGKVDAVIGLKISGAKAEQEGFGKVIERASDYFGHYQHTFTFATDKIIKEKPEVVRGFLAAYRKSVEYIKAHPEEAIQYGTEVLHHDKAAFTTVYTKEIPTWDASGRVDLEGTDNAIKILKELGEIDPKVQVSARQIVNESFLPR